VHKGIGCTEAQRTIDRGDYRPVRAEGTDQRRSDLRAQEGDDFAGVWGRVKLFCAIRKGKDKICLGIIKVDQSDLVVTSHRSHGRGDWIDADETTLKEIDDPRLSFSNHSNNPTRSATRSKIEIKIKSEIKGEWRKGERGRTSPVPIGLDDLGAEKRFLGTLLRFFRDLEGGEGRGRRGSWQDVRKDVKGPFDAFERLVKDAQLNGGQF